MLTYYTANEILRLVKGIDYGMYKKIKTQSPDTQRYLGNLYLSSQLGGDVDSIDNVMTINGEIRTIINDVIGNVKIIQDELKFTRNENELLTKQLAELSGSTTDLNIDSCNTEIVNNYIDKFLDVKRLLKRFTEKVEDLASKNMRISPDVVLQKDIDRYSEMYTRIKDDSTISQGNVNCQNLDKIKDLFKGYNEANLFQRLLDDFEAISGTVRVFIRILNRSTIDSDKKWSGTQTFDNMIVPTDRGNKVKTVNRKIVKVCDQESCLSLPSVVSDKRYVKRTIYPCSQDDASGIIQFKHRYGPFFSVFENIRNSRVYSGTDDSIGINTIVNQVKSGVNTVLFSYGLSGSGKCLALNTPILMYNGTIKKVQDIIVGDLLMGDDSSPRRVLTLARGKDILYKIIPIKGESFTINSNHILSLNIPIPSLRYEEKRQKYRVSYFEKYNNNNTIKFTGKRFKIKQDAENFIKSLDEDRVIDISIKEYLKLPKYRTYLKLFRTGVDFKTKHIDFDPYIIGFWIGDGHSGQTAITTQDSAVVKYFKETLPKYKLALLYWNSSKYSYGINSGNIKTYRDNKMLKFLQNNNMINNKHIPDILKINSREIRLQVLAGLIDSDGHYQKRGGYEITQKIELIADDILFLARSLGFAAYKNEKKTSWTYLGVKKYGTAFRVNISGHLDEIPVKIKRKMASKRIQIKDVLVTGFKVDQQPSNNYYGFSIDRNHRFLLGDFTVTHNSHSILGTQEEYGMIQLMLKQLDPIIGSISMEVYEMYGKIQITGKSTSRRFDINKQIINYGKFNIDKGIDSIIKEIAGITKIRRQENRIKFTTNNPDSSRGHLFAKLNILLKNGKKSSITFIDSAGVEDPFVIARTFLHIDQFSTKYISKKMVQTLITDITNDKLLIKTTHWNDSFIDSFLKQNKWARGKLIRKPGKIITRDIESVNKTTVNKIMKYLYIHSLRTEIIKNDEKFIGLFGSIDYSEINIENIVEYIWDMFTEGLFINESLNHLRIFMQKRIGRKLTFNEKSVGVFDYNVISASDYRTGGDRGYTPDKLLVDPRSELKNKEIVSLPELTQQIGGIGLISFLRHLTASKSPKPAKYVLLMNIRTDLDDPICNGAKQTLEFANSVKST
jgi:hypothetical protein